MDSRQTLQLPFQEQAVRTGRSAGDGQAPAATPATDGRRFIVLANGRLTAFLKVPVTLHGQLEPG
jgi:hypothetical protein